MSLFWDNLFLPEPGVCGKCRCTGCKSHTAVCRQIPVAGCILEWRGAWNPDLKDAMASYDITWLACGKAALHLRTPSFQRFSCCSFAAQAGWQLRIPLRSFLLSALFEHCVFVVSMISRKRIIEPEQSMPYGVLHVLLVETGYAGYARTPVLSCHARGLRPIPC